MNSIRSVSRKIQGFLSVGLTVTFVISIFGGAAQAMPGKAEVYRNNELGITVYKDRNDANVFWYVPPVKLYEDNGKVVFYKRTSKDKVSFVFYVVPYMTNELMKFLRGDVPGLQNKTQFKEVQARSFGIQVRQFGVTAMGEKITDFKYLNQPYPVIVTLDAGQAEEFSFFIKNKPGVQANVLIEYETEKMDKDQTIQITFKELYSALNAGVGGRYQFLGGEIAQAAQKVLAKKGMLISGKGDMQIPDVLKSVIQECFDPVRPKNRNPYSYPNGGGYEYPYNSNQSGGNYGRYNDDDFYGYNLTPENSGEAAQLIEDSENLGLTIPVFAENDSYGIGAYPSDDPVPNPNPNPNPYPYPDPQTDPGRNTDPRARPGKEKDGVYFMIRRESANTDKNCLFKQEHFTDTSETVGIPVYLSLLPKAVEPKIRVLALEKKEATVAAANLKSAPLSTGVMVQPGDQYIIEATFAAAASNVFRSGWLIWDSKEWGNPNEDLYYRVGNGPWNSVNSRALIRSDEMYTGEIQFYIDRERIYQKIPGKYKGMFKPIPSFDNVLPQFNVTISGTRMERN